MDQQTTIIDQSTIVPVLLIEAHEHQGEMKQPGDEILVTERQHTWLREQGKVE